MSLYYKEYGQVSCIMKNFVFVNSFFQKHTLDCLPFPSGWQSLILGTSKVTHGADRKVAYYKSWFSLQDGYVPLLVSGKFCPDNVDPIPVAEAKS